MKAKTLFSTVLTVVASTLASFSPITIAAQDYPNRPIRLIVPFSPGGGVDLNARILGAKLTEYLGQPIVIENKPGAGTNIANDLVAKANPDGYTLLINSAAIAINMSLYKRLPFDTLRDFTPVSLFSISPNILVVNPNLPVKNVAELIALAKQRKGAINYASAGSGSTQHLVAELFKARTDTDMLHIPYKGTGPLLTSVIAGDVDLTFANIAPISEHVRTGRLRALATTGSRRSDLMPQIPTMKEAGVDGVEVDVWLGVFAPAGTPSEIVHKLAAAIGKVASAQDVKKALADQGNEAVSSTPEEFNQYLRSEVAKWHEIVKASGATVD